MPVKIRSKESIKMKICSHCGKSFNDENLYCDRCGAFLWHAVACRCGALNAENATFCHKCGTRMNGAKACSCGRYNDAYATVCGFCGKSLTVEEESVSEAEVPSVKTAPWQLVLGAFFGALLLFTAVCLVI